MGESQAIAEQVKTDVSRASVNPSKQGRSKDTYELVESAVACVPFELEVEVAVAVALVELLSLAVAVLDDAVLLSVPVVLAVVELAAVPVEFEVAVEVGLEVVVEVAVEGRAEEEMIEETADVEVEIEEKLVEVAGVTVVSAEDEATPG